MDKEIGVNEAKDFVKVFTSDDVPEDTKVTGTGKHAKRREKAEKRKRNKESNKEKKKERTRRNVLASIEHMGTTVMGKVAMAMVKVQEENNQTFKKQAEELKMHWQAISENLDFVNRLKQTVGKLENLSQVLLEQSRINTARIQNLDGGIHAQNVVIQGINESLATQEELNNAIHDFTGETSDTLALLTEMLDAEGEKRGKNFVELCRLTSYVKSGFKTAIIIAVAEGIVIVITWIILGVHIWGG